ncbi:hypothetical protein BU26DRAFT_562909 [Trematosphaeria pertusa]|uniref:Methyltransferase n=1 Tax=Trematosphaeria pertusa TaxID=390896 RepID=A0A6A6IKN0_9PLEO|nr:uncharacterized protein BU26DRAFT_562909 [Trematosphaeria pertusa]KAF2250946.1 hypothetical protein BU26DRAFT_562909 [Trematosphaeria pertusa]
MCQGVDTEIYFTAKDPIFQTLKPYSFRFPPSDDLPCENFDREKWPLRVQDARELGPNIDVQGFCLERFPTRMSYGDFAIAEKIENVYAKELESALFEQFQARHVRVVDYLVRRRHRKYPKLEIEDVTEAQPASLAHIDFSHEEAISMIRALYGERAQELLQHRWQLINTWRPLKGPLNDWPLAICDAQSFDAQQDALVADVVYPTWSYENVLVHFNTSQKWYYFPGLEVEETLLFRCTDSERPSAGSCPHASFPNPNCSQDGVPRESIEARAFVFYAPIEEFPKAKGTVYGQKE